jgi:hypothetical protein
MPCLKIVNDWSICLLYLIILLMVIVEDFDCVQVPVLSRSKMWKFKDKADNVRINVTVRCVLETIVAVERNMYYIFWVCVCSLSYPACKTHENCHLLPGRLCYIIPHYLINVTTFGKSVFWFSLQLLPETFLILGRTERDITNVYRFSCKVPIILLRF